MPTNIGTIKYHQPVVIDRHSGEGLCPGGDCKHCGMDGADVTYDLIITTRYHMAIEL
jgi:hypothetical protein